MGGFNKNLALVFAVLLTALLILQTVFYRHYAIEMTFLYLREITNVNSADNQRRMAAICNSLGRSKCALRVFHGILDANPNDHSALSNIGMIMTMNGRHKEALPYLRAYFSTGGEGADVYFWYAKTLEAVGETDEALKIYYQALTFRTFQLESVKAIFAILEQQERHLEALSFIYSLEKHLIENDVRRILASRKKRLLNLAGGEGDKLLAREEIRFPSFDGQTFLLPIHDRSVELIPIDVVDARNGNRINERKLNELKIPYHTVGRNRVRLPELKILGQSLSHVQFELCTDCEWQLRRDDLNGLSPRIETSPALSFLVLQPQRQ